MRITFLGAAGEVTGSSFLVECGDLRFMVDCGMFQGRDAERKNRQPWPCDPRSIDFVILTHAHIDHSGLLPRLVAQGFRGKAWSTPATKELLQVMLPDSAYLQEKGADRRARQGGRGQRSEDKAPLYSVQQAQASLRPIRTVDYGRAFSPHPRVRCTFRDAGHILGSGILELWLQEPGGERKLVFSGDLGQKHHPVVRDPEHVASADILLIESTYGNRDHKSATQTLDELAFAVNDTLTSRRGNVVIPSFAVGRTQDMLYLLHRLHGEGRIPSADVYVDSPMALAATRIMLRHPELYDEDTPGLARWIARPRHAHKSGDGLRLHLSESLEDSMRINSVRAGAIILSASGMCEGGRVRHHLRYNIARPECAVVFSGFQAAGTLGRRIVDGAKSIRLGGESYPVRARVFTIGGLSAHADRSGLLSWVDGFIKPPQHTFVIHGEPLSAHALRDDIALRPGWKASVPEGRQTVDL